ncbi:hypothetical protein MHK_001203, partial [Candidatus Magnetomorum sp. HK-1]
MLTLRRRVIDSMIECQNYVYSTPERRGCIPTQSVGTRVTSVILSSYRDVYND